MLHVFLNLCVAMLFILRYIIISRLSEPIPMEGVVIRMASTKKYLEFILDQLSGLDDITYRMMMGEYILYYKGKIFGGIYDDRFLVKNIATARRLMPDAGLESPYDGAKEMLSVTDIDDREFLTRLVNEMYDELPVRKKGK